MDQNNEDDAKRLHIEIQRAVDIIQKSIIDNDLNLFPAVCAMLTIIFSYKKHNADAKNILNEYEKVLSNLDFAAKETDLMH